MPTERDDPTGDAQAIRDAINEGLGGLPPEVRAAASDPVDRRWLAIGLRLGVERPGPARDLLEMIGAPVGPPVAPVEAAAVEAVTGIATSVETAAEPAPGSGTVETAAEPAPDSGSVPVRSFLLARAAAMPASERASMGPEVALGWAAGLTREEIRSLGQVVWEMLAAGAPPDVGRGFGLAWSGGVRLPREELDAMFREFTELQLTVGGILAGRDLRVAEPAPRRGIAALLGPLLARGLPGEAEAAAAMESSGEAGRRGLVALWNAWAAMRFRARIPDPTFELLVRPWVTVVGPLPEG